MSAPSSDFERRELERLRYAQGQRLIGSDLRDATGLGDQRRWWHNRSVHGAYGVAQGFHVELWPPAEEEDAGNGQAAPPPTHVVVRPDQRSRLVVDDQGKVELDENYQPRLEVLSRPGIAYDRYGRELVITGAARLLLPPTYRSDTRCPDAAPMTLWVAYHAEAPLGERIRFEWQDASAASSAGPDGVPIAGIRCGSEGRVELVPVREFGPPLVAPLARPHVAAGSTVPGATAWERWTPAPEGGTELGLMVRVDTTAGTFTHTPCYFAAIHGAAEAFLTQATAPKFADIAFCHVQDATARGFTVAVGLRHLGHGGMEGLLRSAREHLGVTWLGLETFGVALHTLHFSDQFHDVG